MKSTGASEEFRSEISTNTTRLGCAINNATCPAIEAVEHNKSILKTLAEILSQATLDRETDRNQV